jgi:hypothetical protein
MRSFGQPGMTSAGTARPMRRIVSHPNARPSATFDGRSKESSITAITSGITKDSGVGFSMGTRRGDAPAGFGGVRGAEAS